MTDLPPTPDAERTSPTVYIVDDDADLRDSLTGLVRALGHTVQAFGSAAEFCEGYRSQQPGCLILDIRMPGESGLDLYARLVREGQRLPVIFMTAHADVSTAVAAMKTGAIEFLEKPFDRETLADRIEKALAVDARWRDSEQRYRTLDDSVKQLSAVDRETLEMILEGVPNKVMAARLYITERAVELRRQRLMQRLGVRSVPELLELTITHRVLAEVRTVEAEWPLR